MKMISWNVNGIRAAIKKGFKDFVAQENPDILCVQETKARPEQVEEVFPKYEMYWNSAEKKGYSGTLVFTKKKPISVVNDMSIKKHDQEGRVIAVEYENFYLVNVYTPNAQRDLARLGYRMKWDSDFLKYVKKLEENKPVIVCGDLNVAHTEIDLANPKTNRENAGFTDEERMGFTNIVKAGFIDSFREFNQEKGHYTWWSYMHQARPRNIGWRIDYFCLSKSLKSQLKKAFIKPSVMGSDHCPVGILFDA